MLILALLPVLSPAGADPAPPSAKACHDRGMALRHGKGDRRLEDAVVWLEKAVVLAPANPSYLADYGGTCLQIADRRRSFTYAIRGRDAMEKSLAMDPSQVDCRDGLMKFYAKAPWPLGDSEKALAQARAIALSDRLRGVQACLDLDRIFEKSNRRPEAREACRDALRIDPGNPEARVAGARLAAP